MSEEIEVCFITSTSNINTASYRIWVKDLAVYLNEIGTKAYVNKLPNNIKPNIVIILGKSDIDKCNNYKKKYPNNLIGIINPPGGILYKADFIITGSIEEKDSLAMNKNIFIFPLIENQYRKINQKIHNDKSEIIVGIHGSYTHLSKIDPHLKRALEEFSQSIKISLKIISNPMPKKWIYGKPKIKNLIVSDYNFKTFSDDILKCDIGLVPNITDNSPLFKKQVRQKDYTTMIIFFVLKINLIQVGCLLLYNMEFCYSRFNSQSFAYFGKPRKWLCGF